MANQSFSELINGDTPVLVDFYADWCGPCKMMTPVIKELASAYEGKLKVIKIDTDKNQNVAMQYGIRGIPAFKLFKNCQIIWQGTGAMSRQQLEQQLKPFIS